MLLQVRLFRATHILPAWHSVLDGGIEAVHDVAVGGRDVDEDWRPLLVEGHAGRDEIDMAMDDCSSGVIRSDLVVRRTQ